MSLLSNRGRFTQDRENFEALNNTEEKSQISSFGVNPKSMFDCNKQDDVKKEDIKERLKQVCVDKLTEEKSVSSHEEYNKRISRAKEKANDDDIDDLKSGKKKKSIKLKVITAVAMVLVEAMALAGIYAVGTVYRYMNMTQKIEWDIEEVDVAKIDDVALASMKGYKTVAIFGVDSRTGSVDKGNNADVNLIANLNMETGEIQLISLYRDLYLSITDDNLFGKLNSAYRKGGPQQAVKTLNKNFDLKIKNYFAFNWKAVADGIELLGGIDIEITKSEYKYLNAFIHETCIATGIDGKNPAAHYIKSHGFQHLDGVQAVAYGRLRLMDSDFQRVERQKKIIGICLEKAKTLDFSKLKVIVEAILPQIGYAFDFNEMLSIVKLASIARITESAGCPDVSSVRTVAMGSNGDCVVPLNLQKSVTILHEILFNDEKYNPSSAVKNYSVRITELRHKYEEENKLKDQEGESGDNEEIIDESGEKKTTSTTKKKVATRSNASSTNKTSESAPNNLPVVDADAIPEEPESDSESNAKETTAANQQNNLPVNNEQNNTSNTGVPVSGPPGSNNAVSYESPGVPINTTPQAPGQAVSGGPTSSQNGPVSGPPTGSISPNINNNDIVVPIIGAPN